MTARPQKDNQAPHFPRATVSGDRITIRHDSVGLFLEHALADGQATHPANAAQADNHSSARAYSADRRAFYNGFSRDTLTEAIANPPCNLTIAVDELTAEITSATIAPTGVERQTVYGLSVGAEVDPVSYGLCQYGTMWTDAVDTQADRLTLTLACNLSVHSRQSASELLYRGAAAAALADLLTLRGYSVEILGCTSGVVYCGTRSSSLAPRYLHSVLVKPADAPMDVASVALVLSEIAVFRMAFLAIKLRSAPRRVQEGIGQPRDLNEADKAELNADIVCDQTVTSRADAVAWVQHWASVYA